MDNINKLIDEVLEELQRGIVDADIKLYMKMHTTNSSHFEITPVLNLNNKELLYAKINEYLSFFKQSANLFIALSQEGYMKRVITLLFSDMSINDFNDPVLFVQRKIDFINNRLLEDKVFDSTNLESKVAINIVPYGKETPYCFRPSLFGENYCDVYELPLISYGISGNTCYIYAIQDCNKPYQTEYIKKIKRKLYKINKGVYEIESEEYKNYKEGKEEYYPENISDVSPSFILSLTLFLNEISKKGITNIECISYLPIRYEEKIKLLAKQSLKGKDKETINKKFLESLEYLKNIQSNITEKFIRCFYRMEHHFDNIKITSIPFELDDRLHIKLSEFKYTDNEILNELINSNSKTI